MPTTIQNEILTAATQTPTTTAAPITAAERYTYGVEIECFVPAGWLNVGGYHCGNEQPGIFPAGWKVESDSSISTNLRGYVACEIVSPILRGNDGLAQIVKVCAALKEKNARVNPTTGFHIHLGYRAVNMKKLGDLIFLFANLEGAVFASTGTKRREQNHYCRPIKAPYKNLNFNAPSVAAMGANDRYFSLNLYNLVSGRKPTVEIRAFAGTTNVVKIVSYVRMALGILERAEEMQRRTQWDQGEMTARRAAPDTTPALAAHTGASEMTRFFFQMGWNAGRIRNGKKYGMIGEGVAGIPSAKATKKCLMAMAHAYDSYNDAE